MKIAVAGLGYVGLSLAVLLGRQHEVSAADVVPEKVDMVNRRESPIRDEEIEKAFAADKAHEISLSLEATLDARTAY